MMPTSIGILRAQSVAERAISSAPRGIAGGEVGEGDVLEGADLL